MIVGKTNLNLNLADRWFKSLSMVLLLLFISVSTNVFSQNIDITFQKITSQDGLSQNNIRCIFQDSQGFIWLGTYDGLNRYNGHDFTIYRNRVGDSTSLSSNLVSCIEEDKFGNLWIGTDDRGLYRFDRETETFANYGNTAQNPDFLTDNRIVSIEIDKNGDLWAGTEYGLNRLKIDSKAKGNFKSEKFLNSPVKVGKNKNLRIKHILSDKHGNLWIGTGYGLRMLPAKNIAVNNPEFLSLKSGGDVMDIYEVPDGIVFNNFGLYKININNQGIPSRKILALDRIVLKRFVVDLNGEIWGTTNRGLARLTPSENHYNTTFYMHDWSDDTSISKDMLTDIYIDRLGVIWIGTQGGGLNLYNPNAPKFRHYNKNNRPGSLGTANLRFIYEDSQTNLWVGTEGAGMYFLSKSDAKNYNNGFQKKDIHPGANQDNFVYSIVETGGKKPKLWVGNGYPTFLNQIDLTKNLNELNLKPINDEVAGLVFNFSYDSTGILWVGTYNHGLFKLTLDSLNNVISSAHYIKQAGNPRSLSSNIIRTILKDREGNIWIGTDMGLNKLIPSEQEKENPDFIHYTHSIADTTSISHNYILPLFESSTGEIWVGTMGGGLNRVIKGNRPDRDTFESITVKNGLPNNAIKGILEDDGQNLWISSNKGLTRFNPKTRDIKNFDLADGIQDYEFGELACFKRKDGEMLFGGVNGLNAFYPEEITREVSGAPIVLTDFYLFNDKIKIGEDVNGRKLLTKSLNHTNKIELNYNERRFAIGFVGLNYVNQSKSKYAYKLEGFDEDWNISESFNRIASYNNIPPGEYLFTVKYDQPSNDFKPTIAQLKVVIKTPFWMTIYAYIFYLLMALVILFFFRKYSIIGIQEKNKLLLEHFEKEKIEELSNLKLKFFTNITHEFRTPLTLILGPLEQLRKANLNPGSRKDLLEMMHKNANILMRLINQLLDFRKIEQSQLDLKVGKTDIIKVCNNILESFRSISREKNIILQFQHRIESEEFWLDEDKVEKMLYNILSNALKFTPEKGSIELNLIEHLKDKTISIEIKDNGIGIPEDAIPHIFERFYQIEIKDRHPRGTGIGLSFVKGLVELHHGEITCESKLNQGTKFTINLPYNFEAYNHLEILDVSEESFLIKPKENGSQLLEDNSGNLDMDWTEKELKRKSNGHHKKLLIIDDNQDIRNLLKFEFSRDYNLFEAENGKIGLERSKEVSPDIIVCDVMMPEMDGFEFCYRLKTDPEISHIPVILLTAKNSPDNQIKGFDLGADDYVSKPFNIDVLASRLNGLINSRIKLREKFRSSTNVDIKHVAFTKLDEKFLKEIIEIIEENISVDDFSVQRLSEHYNIGQTLLNKKIKACTGMTAVAFIRSIRLKRAAQLLKSGRYNVSEITYEVGFTDLKYFRECFKKEFALTPSEYVKNNKPT